MKQNQAITHSGLGAGLVDPMAGEQALEADAEFTIEHGVDDRVQRRVEVPEPEQDRPEHLKEPN